MSGPCLSRALTAPDLSLLASGYELGAHDRLQSGLSGDCPRMHMLPIKDEALLRRERRPVATGSVATVKIRTGSGPAPLPPQSSTQCVRSGNAHPEVLTLLVLG